MKFIRSGVTVALLATAACATSHPHATDAGALTPFDAPAPSIRFSGKFGASLKILSGSGMVSGSNRLNGSVSVVGDPGSTDRFTVRFEFASDRGVETLWWGIVEGDCNTPGIPLVPPRQLSELYVPTSGNVQTSGLFRSTLTPGATYHLNLYVEGSSTMAGVISCATLKSG